MENVNKEMQVEMEELKQELQNAQQWKLDHDKVSLENFF